MYLIVRKDNMKIVASSIKKPSELDMQAKNRLIYQIDDSEYSIELIGKKLIGFESKHDTKN